MKQNLRRHIVFLAFALVFIAGSFLGGSLLLGHAQGEQSILLNDQVVPLIQKSQLLGPTDGNQTLQLSIGLQLRDKRGADTMLQAVSDPQSPLYKHYLSSQDFSRRFARTQTEIQQVVTFLNSQGFQITSTSDLLIDATGTVDQAQRAFGVQINNYRSNSNGRQFYANASAPGLPESIRPLVISIGGLDNSVAYYPHYTLRTNPPFAKQDAANVPPPLTRPDLVSAYNIAPLHNASIQGQGQTIAIVAFDSYQASDINAYFKSYNLNSPAITNYYVDGVNGAAGQKALETTLDIEVAGAIAPQASFLVYQGPADTMQGVKDTYNRVVSDNKASIVSTSWGQCETNMAKSDLDFFDSLFQKGALQGMSFFAASGDSGAYDCGDANLAVDSPASDPNVTGVGATTLKLNGSVYDSEAAWSGPKQPTLGGIKGVGSGGGLSTYSPPSPQPAQPTWQSGPGVQNAYSNGHREVPDVSAYGDTVQGFNIYCTAQNAGCASNGWKAVGGTSVAAPIWAGSLALINQYLQSNNKTAVSSLNATLYGLFKNSQAYPPFHDVAQGTNLYYPATTGYDMASGIGTPNVYNIARDLSGVANGNGTNSANPGSNKPVELIQNGGFENGNASWQESSGQDFEIVDPTNPHTGQNSTYLCGYSNCNDRIWQSINIPANYTTLTLVYWWYGTTSVTSSACSDTLTTTLQDSTGATIQDQQKICNADVSSSWVKQTFDVSNALNAYKGKSVTLLFHGATANQSSTSSFYVDDVSLMAS